MFKKSYCDAEFHLSTSPIKGTMKHPAGRELSSDWSVKKIIMVVYAKYFNGGLNRKVWWNLNKKILIDNHYGPVRSERSSCRVFNVWCPLESLNWCVSRKKDIKYVTNLFIAHHNQSRYSTVFTAKVVSTVPHQQTHKNHENSACTA